MSPEVDVAIVGAGIAGLGTGIQLARRARESFVILERADDVGGTWRDNRYPGVACDIPSHLYSFSFRPHAGWTRRFAPGAEIQAYLRDCVRAEGLAPHLRLGAELERAVWEDGVWTLRAGTETVRARSLVLATGRLSEPRIPDLPGMLDFPGPIFHSARWDDGVDLTGLRVGIAGSGATAAQVVPALAGRAASLVVFQRSAPYVLPRGDRAVPAAERAAFARDPAALAALRERLFREAEAGLGARKRRQPDLDELKARARAHLEAQVPDPQLRAQLSPDYEIGCKRIVISDDFLPALGRPDVTLEPSALRRFVGRRGLSAAGRGHELDAVVLATGFLSTRPPVAARVEGRDGIRLADRWARGMFAYASTTVHGFPNMFVLDGPNASLGHNSAVHMIETQIGYVLGALDVLGADPAAVLEVTAEAEAAYVAELEQMSAGTVWLEGGCHSWYVDERSGRLTLLWPDTAESFRARNGRFDPRPYRLLSAQG
ncbi:MAG TPA: NAD(P)/FAD-dependent oxidoreductase [Solirubrobacteraceae bacterium]|nr:NAD(P)/FAD-dependent oxidoreductase [Solirubrobacteraceae bacterium]